MKNNTMAILFATDKDSHLKDLTIHRTTASMPFGGRYRLIDFALSNLVSANITKIGIIAKNNYNSLMDHIRQGRDWDLNRKNGGIYVYPPYVFNSNRDVYNSKIEALYTLRGFMMESSEEYVVIADTNIAFSIDFDEVEKFHIEKGADVTVLTYKVENPDLKKIVVAQDKNKRIKDIRLSVDGDKNSLCDLNIYFIKKDLLISLIDKAYAYGKSDFVRDILGENLDDLYVMSYEVKDYVAVIDKIQSYFKHSMDLLDPKVRENLFYKNSTILTKVKDTVPARYGNDAVVKNSIIADGCVIEGVVENSILFRSVRVGKGAVVRNSIVMEDSIIMDGATIDYTITDKDVIIKNDRHLSGHESYPMVVVKGKVI